MSHFSMLTHFEAPRVLVTTYAKYAEGRTTGQWLDLTEYADAEDFEAAARAIHSDEADPELMFIDKEDCPDDLVTESHIDARIWDWLALDTDDRDVVGAYWDNICADATVDEARESFAGIYPNRAAYVEEAFCEGNTVPDNLAAYIDWDSMANDWDLNGDVSFVECANGVMVFRG